jgi:hypothetical protein
MTDTAKSKVEESRKGKPKGSPKTGGRVAGVPNKVTQEFRETVRLLLEANSENVSIWLTQVAAGTEDSKPDPKGALDMITKLAEFAAPKLARTEIAGDKQNPLTVQLVQF